MKIKLPAKTITELEYLFNKIILYKLYEQENQDKYLMCYPCNVRHFKSIHIRSHILCKSRNTNIPIPTIRLGFILGESTFNHHGKLLVVTQINAQSFGLGMYKLLLVLAFQGADGGHALQEVVDGAVT